MPERSSSGDIGKISLKDFPPMIRAVVAKLMSSDPVKRPEAKTVHDLLRIVRQKACAVPKGRRSNPVSLTPEEK